MRSHPSVLAVFDAKRPPGPAGPAASSSVLAAPIDRDGAQRTVGPFAVIVHAKMPDSAPGALPVDVDVRPHPHIGLIAISYVLEGAVTHRDSLGNRCELRAGDLGATVSGRGVVHSERFERMRLLGGSFEMFQLLLALPDGGEDVEPSFFHRREDELPLSETEGARLRWLLPAPPEVSAGLPTMPPILLVDIALEANAATSLPDVPERALYVREGEVEIGVERVRAGQVAVLAPGETTLRALSTARVLAFGGERVGERYLWWNYIHSSLERIESAKAEWREGRVKLPDGDTESFTSCPADDGRPLMRLNRRDQSA